ncbi:hypothetical protein BCR34DRAFT_592345 [Clohesyomyces aquaticus]|uniref:Cora-like Mg2+ transporter protein-domain-containing protein n=1 Tax=Clohesyomyces aquaticus TaxID=1231657 RepID=A0A1Y1YT39_9PLEO|nr:hypothetical protein BCR34DRAFT_592345 [Clohesyomyces aquaticus]
MIRRGPWYRQVLVATPSPRKSPERYAKKWDKDFSKHRDFYEEDTPFLDDLRELRADGNNLELFLRDFVSEVPSCKVKIIQDFCRGALPLSSESGEAEKTEEEPQAWLDDRDSLTKLARANSPWLRAHGFYAQLKLLRFGLNGQPNADRRLIYVKNLGPSYIFALTETASFHQIGALREAFWKHLALKSSLKVKISLIGFKTFSLEFNMPYLALRNFGTRSPDRLGKPMRKRIDLSFFNIPKQANDGHGTYGLQEAHVSLSIIGVDHHRWACYCFADTDIGSACPDDQSHEDEQEETDAAEEEEMKEDPVVSDGQGDEVPEADMPVWDPRDYFLRVVDVRMKQILREWENVVHVVDEGVEDWIAAHPFSLSRHRRRHQGDDVQEAFDWIVEMIGLLRRLLGHFSKTIRVWKRFVASDGDISYFSDISEPHIRQRLDSIRGVFDELIDLDETLRGLNCSCQNLREIMSQILAPVGIVVAYFGTQQEIFHFERNPRSFVISVVVMTLSVNLIALFIFTAGRCSWPKRINYILEWLSPWRSELGQGDRGITPGLPHHV